MPVSDYSEKIEVRTETEGCIVPVPRYPLSRNTADDMEKSRSRQQEEEQNDNTKSHFFHLNGIILDYSIALTNYAHTQTHPVIPPLALR